MDWCTECTCFKDFGIIPAISSLKKIFFWDFWIEKGLSKRRSETKKKYSIRQRDGKYHIKSRPLISRWHLIEKERRQYRTGPQEERMRMEENPLDRIQSDEIRHFPISLSSHDDPQWTYSPRISVYHQI
jgi:hypothetical protein